MGRVTVSAADWDEGTTSPKNIYSFVKSRAVSGRERAALEATFKPFPNAKVADAAGVHRQPDLGAQVDPNILYVLLALSVIVSLFGIVDTLVLRVFERTREIGMLRAIGMTSRQTRRMIRHESVITALIGAVLGIVARRGPRRGC